VAHPTAVRSRSGCRLALRQIARDTRRVTFRGWALAVAAALAPALGASPAAGAIPCSKAAVARSVHLGRFESITSVRCADLTGDGHRDVAWSKSGGGSGGDVLWGVLYERAGRREVARFSGQTHYGGLRIRGRRVLIDSPVYRPEDPNCCPTAGMRTESATWNGRRFVKRLVAVRH
jgi:hypothetical protein